MTALPTSVDSVALRQRLHRASLRSAQLEGVQRADTERRDVLVAEVAAAKGRAALGEEVSRVFDALQNKAHERSVGAFERLLSAILKDVLPDEGKVRLLPQFKANGTWLDVALEKGGQLEDVVDGNGGAVTNVVCAGLRYAALLRTSNRRLMILDEPDCWLKPERVPAFVRVIAQVAAQTATQTFFITHHDSGLLEGQVNVVRFSAAHDGSDRVEAQARAPLVADWPDADAPGIRAIELFNFRRHAHTLVPCYPGATAYIGDNNLGKSTALVSAFKAVAYGESDDTMIRHGAEEARIVLHLESGKRIEWSRSSKRSPAVVYRYFEAGADKPTMEGRPKTRNQAPDWVAQVLGVQRVDDLDIQVGNQKSPVFLLNDSAPRRAQILSVGRESGHLKALMKRYEERKGADRETIRQGEAQVTRLNYRLTRLGAVETVSHKLAELVIESDDMLQTLERQEQLTRLIERLDAVHARVRLCERQVQALRRVPAEPVLADTERLAQVLVALERRSKLPALASLPVLPTEPVLADVEAMLTLGKRLAQASRRAALAASLPGALPEMPQLHELQGVTQQLQHLERIRTRTDGARQALAQAEQALAAQHAAVEALKDELGDACPLCGGALPEDGLEHTHSENHTHA